MKVLFAVNSEAISEAIIKRYQKEYKEVFSYKNVYYFNAILKEIQKDKSYDRIVISEDLEAFPNNNYDAIDKFIFEKLDDISDEALDTEGNDTSIILICSDRRTPGDSFLVKLFSIGVYNALLGNDRSIENVCKLLNKPRIKKEAKTYYRMNSNSANYSNEDKDEVSELEIQNILAHFKKLGKDTDKYADSFNNIAEQYTDEQLKVIINCFPKNVRVVLENNCQKYQDILKSCGIEIKKSKQTLKKEAKTNGITLNGIVENKIGQNKVNGPIVIPSSVKKTRTVAASSIKSSNAKIQTPTVEIKKVAKANVIEDGNGPVKKRMVEDTEVEKKKSANKIENVPEVKKKAVVEKRIKKAVEADSIKEESLLRKKSRTDSIVDEEKSLKKKKNDFDEEDDDLLIDFDETVENDDDLLMNVDEDETGDEDDDLLMDVDEDETGDDDEDDDLLMDVDEDETGDDEEEDDLLMDVDEDETGDEDDDLLVDVDEDETGDEDDDLLVDVDEDEIDDEDDDLLMDVDEDETGDDEEDDDLLVDVDEDEIGDEDDDLLVDVDEDETGDGEEDDDDLLMDVDEDETQNSDDDSGILSNMIDEFDEEDDEYADEVELPDLDDLDDLDSDGNVTNKISSNEFDDEDDAVETETPVNTEVQKVESIKSKVNYSMSSLNSLLTRDKKIVTFVGTTKNGTSFLINNLAALFSSLGINTAILDMTKNKNSYYVYTNNKEELRNIAYNSISKLQSGGFAEGIKVGKNLSVYTALPNDGKDYSDAEPILLTLVQNHSLVLIDCDFDTDPSYFASCQEIYLVQSLDALTIQPLTAFLRDLKAQGVLETEKIRVVINKEVKVRSLSAKAIIGGMSFYNDPSMSYMTELFDRDMVKACSIPFEENTYSRYLDALANCNITINGYSKQFMNKLRTLGDMVYPLVSKTTYGKINSNTTYAKNNFSNNMNNTLNQMKKKY